MDATPPLVTPPAAVREGGLESIHAAMTDIRVELGAMRRAVGKLDDSVAGVWRELQTHREADLRREMRMLEYLSAISAAVGAAR